MYLAITILSLILFKHSKKILIHSLIWLLFIIYEVSVAIFLGAKASWIDYVLSYLINIVLFYANAGLLFYLNKKFRFPFVFMLFILIEIALYILLALWTNSLFTTHNAGSFLHQYSYSIYIRTMWRGIYFIGLSTGFYFAIRVVKEMKKTSELRILQLESSQSLFNLQNAYLRAQLNPHLLFNTLSLMYIQELPVSDKTSQSIILLSQIMQYALQPVAADGKVPLEEEIIQVENFLALSQLANNNKFSIQLEIDIDDDCNNLRIPPLLLLTFVENIFKHGDLLKPADPAIVNIKCSKGKLAFYSYNTKKNNSIPASQVGINNIQKLLENYYQPGQATLDLDSTGNSFTVRLNIAL